MSDLNADPSNYPPGPDYTTIQASIDYADGLSAGFTGQPFYVYRLNSSASGNVVQSSTQILSNFPISRKRLKMGDDSLETDVAQGTYWYKLIADLSTLQVGDICIMNDPVYGLGSTQVAPAGNALAQFVGFAIAEHAPLKAKIGGRLNCYVSIFRPASSPDSSGYEDQTQHGALPLLLTNGQFVLGTSGQQPALIPAGFMPAVRDRGNMYPDQSNNVGTTVWKVYLPPLPGFNLKETDIIATTAGDQYRIINPYRQEAGTIGYQLICMKVKLET